VPPTSSPFGHRHPPSVSTCCVGFVSMFAGLSAADEIAFVAPDPPDWRGQRGMILGCSDSS
jgi:hypothetical protein